MRNAFICLNLLALVLLSPVAFSSGSIVTPGAGFVLYMDDLVNISATQGTDTVLRGTTQVGGYWDYFIEGAVTVSGDDVLFIQPWERLVFRPDYNSTLEIEGQLDASAQAVDEIILTSLADYTVQNGTAALPFSQSAQAVAQPSEERLLEQALTSDLTTHPGVLAVTSISGVTGPAAGDWFALTFQFLQGQPMSVVRNVTIRGADIGIKCLSVPPGTLTIEQCTIEWNHTGIYLQNSSPLITDNRSLSYHVIKLLNGNLVRSTGTAIYMQGSSNPVIRRNTFIGNQGDVILISGKGVAPSTPLPRLGSLIYPEDTGGNNLLIHYNDPPYNTEAGRVGQRHVYNETANTIYALRNYWGTTDPSYIESTLIYDDTQDSLSGPVIFQPFFLNPRTGVAEEAWTGYR